MADMNPLVKGMVSLLKHNVENSFQALSIMQGQSEQIARLMMEQGATMQTGSKKFMEQWVETMKKSQEEYQKNLKEQLSKLDTFVAAGKKEA